MKILDTFAGIGGFSYAAEKLIGGFETTQFIEIDPFCQKVLKKHWSHVPIHDDIRTFTAKPFQYQVICGGFPCQDISVAGLQKGITEETRSGLFFELMRVIRMVRPKYVVLENVAAILNRGLDIVLRELSEAGYDAEWSVIPASSVGACHQRSRWWLVAYPNSKQSSGTESEIQAGRIFSSSSNRSGNVTNSNYNGSSSSKESRSIEKTNGGAEEREDFLIESKGSCKSKNSRDIQISSTNTKSQFSNVTKPEYLINKKSSTSKFRNSSVTTSNSSSNRLQGKVGSRIHRPTWKTQNIRRLNSNWRQYISKPTIRRGDDGLRNRVDRLRSLGNSVVPQCAAIPLQRVKDLYATTS